MNIYWCYEKYDSCGLFVIAETRGKAKLLFANEVDEDYIDIRSQIYRRGVFENVSGIIDPEDTELLEKYGLEYTDDEDFY